MSDFLQGTEKAVEQCWTCDLIGWFITLMMCLVLSQSQQHEVVVCTGKQLVPWCTHCSDVRDTHQQEVPNAASVRLQESPWTQHAASLEIGSSSPADKEAGAPAEMSPAPTCALAPECPTKQTLPPGFAISYTRSFIVPRQCHPVLQMKIYGILTLENTQYEGPDEAGLYHLRLAIRRVERHRLLDLDPDGHVYSSQARLMD